MGVRRAPYWASDDSSHYSSCCASNRRVQHRTGNYLIVCVEIHNPVIQVELEETPSLEDSVET